MKNIFKKIFLVFTILGMSLATINFQTVSASESKMAVFSIDAGRKYLSEEQLMKIIDKAAYYGYTDVQIILGNDGFRFLLDDMTITVDDYTYTSEQVQNAIINGNKAYYDDPNGNALSQDEMDRICAYAKEKGIGIIPVINSPGHMDALLSAIIELGITDAAYTRSDTGATSQRTIDLTNAKAKEFVYQIIQKYAHYFAQSGVVEIFNFAADEYAGDVFDMMASESPWEKLVEFKLYDEFINYINELAKIIKNESLTPMCFNDGVYACYEQAGVNYHGVIDTDIIISVWLYMGGNGASPQYLVDKGFKIMNTNFMWYWVLGIKTADEYPAYYLDWVYNGINSCDFNTVSGGTNIDAIGSTQCVWCDIPSNEFDLETIDQLMNAYSTKYSDYLIRSADYSKVNEAISKIPADLSQYSEESVNNLNKAVEMVIYNKRINEQEVVDGYATAIENAIKELELKKVTTPNNPEVDKPSVDQPIVDNPVNNEPPVKTGDTTNLTLFACMFVLSGLYLGKKFKDKMIINK